MRVCVRASIGVGEWREEQTLGAKYIQLEGF